MTRIMCCNQLKVHDSNQVADPNNLLILEDMALARCDWTLGFKAFSGVVAPDHHSPPKAAKVHTGSDSFQPALPTPQI